MEERRGWDPPLLDPPQRVNGDRCVARQLGLTDVLLATGPRELGGETLAVLTLPAVELLARQITILGFLSANCQGGR